MHEIIVIDNKVFIFNRSTSILLKNIIKSDLSCKKCYFYKIHECFIPCESSNGMTSIVSVCTFVSESYEYDKVVINNHCYKVTNQVTNLRDKRNNSLGCNDIYIKRANSLFLMSFITK